MSFTDAKENNDLAVVMPPGPGAGTGSGPNSATAAAAGAKQRSPRN